ncbi:MAG TPA: type II CAAX endopeptidase family protein [Longimicrobiales bacterium]|nr:type II CAAX endopeptidase family protein [Longimicrobiales bacterium]
MMALVDHLFILALFVVQPVVGALEHRRFRRRIDAGEPPDRLRVYRRVVLLEWATFAVLLGAWGWLDRPAALLGFSAPVGTGFAVAAGITLLVSILLAVQWRAAIRMTEPARVKLRAAFGFVAHFLPQTDRELRGMLRASVTAGIVEETLYRGFAIWYVGTWIGVPAAVVLTSVAFGLGHLYQGGTGALRAGLVGLALAGLFVLSGSLWVPIAAHMLLDVLQGLMIREVYRPGAEPPVAASVG